MDTRKAVKTYHRNLAIVLAIIVAIFAAIPLVVDKPYIINIFVLTFYMSTLSMAWNILGGITGQNSLGLAAYMGLGAYVCCLVVTKTGMNPWVAAVLDMLVVGVVAGVIFFPSLILRGPYFTLVSIAFAESIRQFIINSEFFGRASGVGLPFGKDSFAQFRFTSKVPYYYIGFIMMVGVYLIMKKIGRSKLGFALRTIREDEDAAAAIGINPTKYKVIAVVISAIIAGLVGFFYVSYIRYIDPDIMIQSKSTEIVLPAVVGGAAYIEGPLIGGLIMTHGDNNGLVLPPKIAPIQVIVLPVAMHKAGVLEKASELKDRLVKAGLRVKLDDSDNSMGWKCAQYEMKGVPVRVEIGPRDIEAGQCVLVRRNDGEKTVVPLENLEAAVSEQLALVQKGMFEKAKQNLDNHIYEAHSLEEAKQLQAEHGGFIKTMWCGELECELKMKEEGGMSSRCMPLKQEHLGDTCPICGKPARKMIYWGIAY